MIRDSSGDIFGAIVEAIVNPVNCVGVMGAGLALQVRKRYPDAFATYAKACARGQLAPGGLIAHDRGFAQIPRYIVNLPTKRHWRDPSRLADIDAGLVSLVDFIEFRRVRAIAIPALGSGLGGLAWEDVRPRIVAALSGLDGVDVLLFGPRGL